MITSMQNKTVKELLKLKQKKYRKDYYLVETNHLVEEAIKAKQTDLVISTEPVDLGVENLVVSKEIMEKLAFTKTPQPIMARCFIQKNKILKEGKSPRDIYENLYKKDPKEAIREFSADSSLRRM